jgi:hypothetical protein
MPRYHFDIDDGRRWLDIQGDAMANWEEAQEHAERLACALAKSNPHHESNPQLHELSVVVRDECGQELCRVPLAAGRPIH